MRHALELLPLIVMLLTAAAVDLRSRRIPNWLTATMCLAGIARTFVPGAAPSPTAALAGLAAGFALTFVMFALGAMGGGDVKLFAGIGAWLGAGLVFDVFIVESVVGMAIVLAQAAHGGRLTALLRGSTVLVMNAAVRGDLSCPADAPGSPQLQKRLPYAVPTLAATLIVLSWGTRPF